MRKHGGFSRGSPSPFVTTWLKVGLWAQMVANVSGGAFCVARYFTAKAPSEAGITNGERSAGMT
jgi:hypothetical protein